jgi:acyl-CoA thioesterase II
MTSSAQPIWDGRDLEPLLRLEPTDPGGFRTYVHDQNMQGRIYGGQLLAQAAAAAALCVDGRLPTYVAGLFLRGATVGPPIDYAVEILQHGKRFTSARVRGTQSNQPVIDVHVSFQAEQQGYEHELPLLDDVPPPESCRSMAELHQAYAARLTATGYHLADKPTLEMRFVDPEPLLFQPNPAPRVSYWLRPRMPVAADPLARSLATVYLSDFMSAYSAASVHQPLVGARDALYLASLNHAIWLYATTSPDDWLLFVTESPKAANGRGLSIGRIYDRQHRLVGSLAQDVAMTRKTA